MSRSNDGGFTLAEMMISVSLIAIIFIGIFDLMTPVIQTQITIYRYQLVQSEAFTGLKAIQTQTAQASVITSPQNGTSADSLSGCSNYSTALDAPLDPSQPVGAFQICLGATKLYLYQGAACPMAAVNCGSGNPQLLANNISYEAGQPKVFVLPANENTVEVHFAVNGTSTTQVVDTAFAVEGSGGADQ